MSIDDFRVLSVIPPMTQLNTPYPSTAYLTGFLRSRGIAAVQEDLALALVLDLFSPQGLDRGARARRGAACIANDRRRSRTSSPSSSATARRSRRPSASCRGATRRSRTASWAARFLPEGARFRSLDVLRRRRRRRSAGLGLRRAGPAGPRPPPRHAVPQRPRRRAARCRRWPLRVRALCRVAGASQPTFDPLAEALAAAAQPRRRARWPR